MVDDLLRPSRQKIQYLTVDTAQQPAADRFNVMEEYMMNFQRIIPLQAIRTVGFILLASVLLTACASTSASKEEMAVASEQLSIAKTDLNSAINAGGNDFAPLLVRSAMEKISSAESAMASKEYTRARRLAEQARVDAQLAEETARTAKAQKAAEALKEGGRILREEMER